MFGGKYQKSVDRAYPGCIIFLLDQSYSMNDGIAGAARPKAEALATAINRFVSDLIVRCERGEEKPRHYFDLAVIGYTTDRSDPPNSVIGSVLQGPLAGREVVSVVDLFDNPLEIETRERMQDDGAGGLVPVPFKLPVWYKRPNPDNMGGTPMCAALDHCREIAEAWCAAHPESFPPVVIHLTDGEANDGDPEPPAEALKALATNDGNLLLFNCHLSESQATSVAFPSNERELTDDRARVLFRMSSELPDSIRARAEAQGQNFPPGTRGMAFNADGAQMLLLIQTGTLGATAAAAPPPPPHLR